MKWLQVSICLISASVPLVVDPCHWPDLRTQILVFLSVLLGAVLFRLGRGLPQLEIGSLSLGKVQRLADAYKVVGDRLVWVFTVTTAAIILTVVNEPLLAYFQNRPLAVRTIGCVTVFVVTLSVVRAWAVVIGDRDLIRQQAELLKLAARKRLVDKVTKRLDDAEGQNPLTPSEGYGGIRKPRE